MTKLNALQLRLLTGEIRAEIGREMISLKEIAAQMDCRAEYISMILRGHKVASAEQLKRLWDIIGDIARKKNARRISYQDQAIPRVLYIYPMEAAAILKCSMETVRRYMRAGRLKGVDLGFNFRNGKKVRGIPFTDVMTFAGVPPR